MDLSDVKSKLSGAYLRALTGKLDFNIQESSREFDNDGIDFQIKKKGEGGISSIINIQLKGVSISSKSMIKETDSEIKYTLKKDYSSLPTPSYLVIVVFPPENEFDSWCKLESDQLLLRKCAYYQIMPKKKGQVTIPKSNLLTEASLESLFISPNNVVDIF
jgi:hypothetical protein